MWSLVVFDPVDDPTRIILCGFLMGDFLKLGPWSGGWAEKILAHFIAHCESCAQDVRNTVLVIRVCCCHFCETETLYCRTLYLSL